MRFSLTEPAAVKWEKSVCNKQRERERERGASRLFFVSSLFSSETISIRRDELTTNVSLSRSIGSLFLSSLLAEIEKGKEVRRESVLCPGEETHPGTRNKKNYTRIKKQRRKKRAKRGERSKRFHVAVAKKEENR